MYTLKDYVYTDSKKRKQKLTHVILQKRKRQMMSRYLLPFRMHSIYTSLHMVIQQNSKDTIIYKKTQAAISMYISIPLFSKKHTNPQEYRQQIMISETPNIYRARNIEWFILKLGKISAFRKWSHAMKIIHENMMNVNSAKLNHIVAEQQNLYKKTIMNPTKKIRQSKHDYLFIDMNNACYVEIEM